MIDPQEKQSLAPTGILRAAINVGNAVLAARGPTAGDDPTGISVDLARYFARRMGVALKLVTFDAARESVEAVRDGVADFGFFAVDPKRGESIRFTSPYVLIEGSYLVSENSRLQHNEDVDQADHTVVVGRGSAYDLFLSRTLHQARIVRAPTSPAVVDTFLASGADVAAGVRQQLEKDARRVKGLRLLDGHFMVIAQAMGVSCAREESAIILLSRLLKEAQEAGVVAQSAKAHGVGDVTLAPF